MHSATIKRSAQYLRNSSNVLSLGGVILVGLGLYFMFVRPPLLPEDARYMGRLLNRSAMPSPDYFCGYHVCFLYSAASWRRAGFLPVILLRLVFATGRLALLGLSPLLD